MSEVTHPKESVYNWMPLVSKDKETEMKKTSRYVSKFRPAVILESKLQKGKGKTMRTMGPAKVELPSPENYLKKHSKEPKLPEKTDSSKDPSDTHFCTMRKPAVPARTEQPLMGIPAKRDFKETTIAVPRKPESIQVDSSQGHRELLENSGLVPKYTMKNIHHPQSSAVEFGENKSKSTLNCMTAAESSGERGKKGKVTARAPSHQDYGKTPVYLQKRKEAEQKAQEHDRLARKEMQHRAIQRLPDEERQAVLEALKKEWDTYMQMYQRIPFLVETPSQKAHKIELEKRMDELDKKISLIEKFKTIYIANDEVSHCSEQL